jgi:cell division protein FtsB
MKFNLSDRYNLFLLIVFAGALVYILLLGNNSLLSRLQLQNKIRQTITDINQIKKENQRLDNEIQRLKNDDLYVQMLIRKLGYIRPDETVYRFMEEEPVTNAGAVKKSFSVPMFFKKNGRLLFLAGLLVLLTAFYLVMRLRTRTDRKNKIDND